MNGLFHSFLHELDEAIFPSSIYCVSCGALIDRSRMYSLCDACMDRFHWITGRTCDRCGKALPDTSRGRLCYDCMREDHFFSRGFSCLTYGLHERELMMDLKYAGKGYLARIFGDMMFDRLQYEISQGLFAPSGTIVGADSGPAKAGGAPHTFPGAPTGSGGVPAEMDGAPMGPVNAPVGMGGAPGIFFGAPDAGTERFPPAEDAEDPRDPGNVRVDLIVPVPVSRGRMRTRGYNQSAIMARQLARRWQDFADGASEDLPLFPPPTCRSQLMERTRETRMLRSLNPTERRMALKDVFAVSARDRDRVPGRTILLVDDIYTTGATADACSEALLRAGADRVYLLSLASGGNRRPGDLEIREEE